MTELERVGADLARARARLAAATSAAQTAGLRALADGQKETAVARALGVDRMTVRKWAGKR